MQVENFYNEYPSMIMHQKDTLKLQLEIPNKNVKCGQRKFMSNK